MNEEELQKYIEFKQAMGELVREWYEGCPRPLQFVSKVIKLYKEYFGKDYATSETN